MGATWIKAGQSPAIRSAARLAALACEVDEAVCGIDADRLTDGEALVLSAPLHHLTLVVAQLGQAVYQAEALDQRPRLARLREAA